MNAETTDKDFPDKGILWRDWNDDTLRIIQEKNRPVLLFVADTDPFVWPFLREIFKAMSANARLRQLLNDFYSAVFVKADSIPVDLEELGAGSKYHIVVLSPYGLTPMVTIEIQRSPEEVVRTIVEILKPSMSGGDEHLNMGLAAAGSATVHHPPHLPRANSAASYEKIASTSRRAHRARGLFLRPSV